MEHKKRREPLVYASVESVAIRLLSEGIHPSEGRVREITGGSATTVTRHLRRFWHSVGVLLNADFSPPPQVMSSIISLWRTTAHHVEHSSEIHLPLSAGKAPQKHTARNVVLNDTQDIRGNIQEAQRLISALNLSLTKLDISCANLSVAPPVSLEALAAEKAGAVRVRARRREK